MKSKNLAYTCLIVGLILSISGGVYWAMDYGAVDVGGIISGFGDGSKSKNITFTSAGHQTVYINVPKDASISSATMDLAGRSVFWGTPADATLTAGYHPNSLVIGDLNNDGRNDVAVIDYYSTDHDIRIYYQKANGSISTTADLIIPGAYQAAQNLLTSIDIGDLNNDGLTDIAVSRHNKGGEIYYQTANHSFSSTPGKVLTLTGLGPDAIAVGDVNNDGLMDVIVSSSYSSYYIDVYLQNNGIIPGNPNLTLSTWAGSETLTIGDVNGDGRKDIIVSNGDVFYQKSGNIKFNTTSDIRLNFSCPSGSWCYLDGDPYEHGVSIGDLNNDGRNDVALVKRGYWDGNSQEDSALLIYYQQSDGTLRTTADRVLATGSNTMVQSVGLGDLNGDGLNDVAIAVTYSAEKSVRIYYQKPDNSFSDAQDITLTPNNPYSLAVGDVNNDGRNDIVVAELYNNSAKIYYQKNKVIMHLLPPNL